MSDTSLPGGNNEGNSRAIIGLIAGIPLTMILAASWLWYFVVQGDIDLIGAIGTANNGTLLDPPRQMEAVAFRDDAGAAFAWEDLEQRWTIVVPHQGAVCDAQCERRLYFTRQIHIALGRDFKRVQRVMVNDHSLSALSITIPQTKPEGWPEGLVGERLADYLAVAQQGLIALEVDTNTWGAMFPELAADANQWYLVDPAGWIMMRFDDSLDYKAVLSDLKFLLKNSGGA